MAWPSVFLRLRVFCLCLAPLGLIVALSAAAGLLLHPGTGAGQQRTFSTQGRARGSLRSPVPGAHDSTSLSSGELASALLVGSEPDTVRTPRCRSFFTIVATMWEHDETCATAFNKMQEYMAVLSAQMAAYGTNLTVYATRAAADRKRPACQLCFPRIQVVDFDPAVLLDRHGFTSKDVDVIRSWGSHERRADLYRLLIAQETQMTYIDTDIVLLAPSVHVYMSEYIAACVWADSGPSLEITNAGFCLSTSRLQQMIDFAKGLLKTGKHFKYTEFGPMLFMDTTLNAEDPLVVLSQNHPVRFNITKIVSEYKRYGHQQFHFTGYIRGRWKVKGMAYKDVIQRLLMEVGLPSLDIPAAGDPRHGDPSCS